MITARTYSAMVRVIPVLLKYDKTPDCPGLSAALTESEIGLMPANQYVKTAKTSQISPKAHRAPRHGAFLIRSGRENRDTTAFTPGSTQLNSAIRMLNQIVDTRFSFPSGGAMDFGKSAKFCRIARTTQRPTATRIAFSGARSRSLTLPNHFGTWRSMLQASEIRLMRLM